jgi:hypothetical protein
MRYDAVDSVMGRVDRIETMLALIRLAARPTRPDTIIRATQRDAETQAEALARRAWREALAWQETNDWAATVTRATFGAEGAR